MNYWPNPTDLDSIEAIVERVLPECDICIASVRPGITSQDVPEGEKATLQDGFAGLFEASKLRWFLYALLVRVNGHDTFLHDRLSQRRYRDAKNV